MTIQKRAAIIFAIFNFLLLHIMTKNTTAPAHTPAPWVVKDYDFKKKGKEYTRLGVFSETSRSWITDNIYAHTLKNGAKANARLIAAAPELLEACVELRRIVIDDYNDRGAYAPDVEMATKAISKAKGK